MHHTVAQAANKGKKDELRNGPINNIQWNSLLRPPSYDSPLNWQLPKTRAEFNERHVCGT